MSEVVKEFNNVPDGYEIVQLGPKSESIPSEWSSESLSNWLLSLETGGRPKTSERSESDSVLSIGGAHIYDGSFDLDEPVYIPEEYYENLNSGKIEKDDILLVKDGATIGKSMYVSDLPEDDAAVNSHVYILRVNSERYDERFLYHFINSQTGLSQIIRLTTGSAQAGLNRTFQQAVKVPTPPLSEQHRIANVLSTVDEQIQQTDEIIRRTQELKRGLMKDLLHQGVDHSDFKEMYIGPKRSTIPAEWGVVALDEIADIQSGSTPKRGNEEYWRDGTIPWVKSGEFNDRVVSQAEEKITEKALDETGCTVFPQGTLLIALYGKGTVSKTARLGMDAATNQAIAGLLPKNGSFDPRYLQYYLIDSRNTLLNVTVNPSSDTGRTNIYLSALRKFKVPFPPIEEQQAIADRIAAVDAKIADEKETKQHYQDLKRGLMQDLLTGNVRVDAD
jgi:type I restriction enzyme S subunit